MESNSGFSRFEGGLANSFGQHLCSVCPGD